ncbi:hypothetical protein CASFOL_002210 [Castilleja foliolosa]|uniref:FBD domain-containing protein n=1 Tax=Castilleja foliolosa TaxID=1961234 RepID=A0ABD3EE80_9LAMI
MATSILATRWRFLWTYVPIIVFGCDIFNSRMGLTNIVNSVIQQHKLQRINLFQLFDETYNDCSEYELDSWITTDIDRNVQLINLGFDLFRKYKLPQCFFTCKTLVGVTLYHCGGIPSGSSGAIYMPNLKNLLLYGFYYEVEEALPRFLSGCPVLEDLTLIRIGDIWIGDILGCLNISSPSIKRLKVDIPFESSDFGHPQDMVIINAPALEHLDVCVCSYEHVSISSKTTSIVEVIIQFDQYGLDARDYFYTRRQVLKFLNSVRSIKRVKLLGQVEEFTGFGEVDSYVKFNNLVKLELTVDWQFLPSFLERADKLEVLIIREGYKCLKNGMEPIENENQSPCLLNSLKTVTIHEFGCTEQELNAVGYILTNSRVLKRMEIYSRQNDTSLGEKFDALQKISFFRRGSRECEVAFS